MRVVELSVEDLEGDNTRLRIIVVLHVSVDETAWISTCLSFCYSKLFCCGVSSLTAVEIEEFIPARNPEAVEVAAQGGGTTSLHAHDKQPKALAHRHSQVNRVAKRAPWEQALRNYLTY